MSLSAFADILVKRLSDEQLGAILQTVTDEATDGACPICGEEDVPVDAEGNEIEGSNVEHADEWRECHNADCIVTLIEASRATKVEKK